MDFELNCPECEERLAVAEDMAGESVECPGCGADFDVPAAAPKPKPKPKAPRRSCPECGTKLPHGKSRCPECGESFAAAKQRKREAAESSGGGFAPEKAALDKGMVGGIAMMVIGAVWFFGGLAAGYIFYYAPVLFLLGVFGFFKGMAQGNVAGKRAPATRRRRR